MATSRFLSCLLIFAGISSYGQTYKITRYSAKDSLPSGPVHAVTQDSAGFIWIGSDRGLYRYDGISFLPVHDDSVIFLAESKEGSIVGTNRKIFRLNSDYPFERVSIESVVTNTNGEIRRPQAILSDTGVLWWSDNQGIHSWHEKRQKDFRFISRNKRSQFFLAEIGTTLLAISRSGQLFFLGNSGNTFVPVVDGSIHSTVNDIIPYSDSSLLVASDGELSLLTIKDGDLVERSLLYRGDISHLAIDRHQNVWTATSDNKLVKFYPSSGKFVARNIQDGTEPHRISDLSFPGITNLFVDRHNNLWVSHREGLALVSDIPFVVVNPALPNEIIRSAAFMETGRAYLSGIGGFFETIHKGFNDYDVRPAKLGKNIYPNAICNCGGRLWLSTVEDEMYSYSKGVISKPFSHPRASDIFYIFCDTAGDVWVSRGQEDEPLVGIMKITDGILSKEYGRNDGFVTRMLVTKQDRAGTVYVAGIGDTTYLYRYDRSRDAFTNLSVPMNFDHGENFEVHDFAVADDSTVWLASTAGLLVLKGESVRKVNIEELYGGEAVAVTLSRDGVVWASTEKNGLIRYTTDGHYALFNIEAGLQSDIMWYRSLFTDSEGKLWAGSREGMTVSTHANPEARKTETPVLLGVADDGSQNNRKHVFNYLSSVDISFVSLNYPTRTIEYQYRINDEPLWRQLRTSNQVQLKDLENGKYLVHIRARQAGGFYWSDPLNYSFTVLPPWYLSKEAFLIYALLLVLLMVGGTRIYNRRLLREKNRLEVKVRERTQELVKKQEEIISQNQELHQLSDVLAANNENIVSQKEIIEKQNYLLHHAKAELEKKVDERTRELQFANEELAQQNVQLEQFAFMTAHNLRAPVARLLGLTSLLDVNGNLAKEENELLRRIRESSKSLDETIREISEILHIKKGLHGSFAPVNLKSVWNRILPSFAHEIDGNKIKVEAHFDDNHVIKGIEPFVYSVFYNVISNGIKYSDNRKCSFIRGTVSTTDHDITVSFEDNGIGFNSSQYADKLFKPFTRFNNIKEGRGLGLYLMKIQMEMMGGTINLISHLDEGTRITLKFVKAD
jgi:signal transduction histidine kinase